MTEQKNESMGPEAIFSQWMKMTNQFWETMTGTTAKSSGEKKQKATPGGDRTRETIEASLNAWRILGSIMADPENLERMNKGAETAPEVFMKMMQSTWSGLHQLQSKWFEKAVKMGGTTTAYDFEHLDQEALKLWSDIYEQEFRQYLKVPQLGLTRFYQERVAQVIDRSARFQTAMAEYMQLLSLPMEKSIKVLQQELTQQAEKGEIPDNSREYYQRWIKILEGHYMTLFKSPEYTRAMADTLAALQDFTAAKDEVWQDILSQYPVPTQKEIDELYKEIYLLKKRIKALEKRQ